MKNYRRRQAMTRVFCKKTEDRFLEPRLSFFVEAGRESHYLFSQSFTKEVYEFSKNGVSLDKPFNHSLANRNKSILKIVDKLPSHIRYIEKEYGLTILHKTAKKRHAA
jgi:hypothetical protein